MIIGGGGAGGTGTNTLQHIKITRQYRQRDSLTTLRPFLESLELSEGAAASPSTTGHKATPPAHGGPLAHTGHYRCHSIMPGLSKPIQHLGGEGGHSSGMILIREIHGWSHGEHPNIRVVKPNTRFALFILEGFMEAH